MSNDQTQPHLVTRDKQHAVVVREVVAMNAMQECFGRAFGQTMGAAQAQGRQIVGMPFGMYFGVPTDSVDVAAGFPIDAPVTADSTTQPIELPGGKAVEMLHIGTYDSVGESYNKIMQFMGEHHLTPSTVMWESYLNEPDPAHPEAAQTLITWPVNEN